MNFCIIIIEFPTALPGSFQFGWCAIIGDRGERIGSFPEYFEAKVIARQMRFTEIYINSKPGREILRRRGLLK